MMALFLFSLRPHFSCQLCCSFSCPTQVRGLFIRNQSFLRNMNDENCSTAASTDVCCRFLSTALRSAMHLTLLALLLLCPNGDGIFNISGRLDVGRRILIYNKARVFVCICLFPGKAGWDWLENFIIGTNDVSVQINSSSSVWTHYMAVQQGKKRLMPI